MLLLLLEVSRRKPRRYHCPDDMHECDEHGHSHHQTKPGEHEQDFGDGNIVLHEAQCETNEECRPKHDQGEKSRLKCGTRNYLNVVLDHRRPRLWIL